MVSSLKEKQREKQGEAGIIPPDFQILCMFFENPNQEQEAVLLPQVE